MRGVLLSLAPVFLLASTLPIHRARAQERPSTGPAETHPSSPPAPTPPPTAEDTELVTAKSVVAPPSAPPRGRWHSGTFFPARPERQLPALRAGPGARRLHELLRRRLKPAPPWERPQRRILPSARPPRDGGGVLPTVAVAARGRAQLGVVDGQRRRPERHPYVRLQRERRRDLHEPDVGCRSGHGEADPHGRLRQLHRRPRAQRPGRPVPRPVLVREPDQRQHDPFHGTLVPRPQSRRPHTA